MPFLRFWAILRSTGGDCLHSSESIEIEKLSVFYFCSPGLGLRVLSFAVWAGFPPGWYGGFYLWGLPDESLVRGRASFNRLILPDSRALDAGLPGLPGSWSLELLPPSCSGCVRLTLPLLFITPFAILLFPRENFGFEGVGGVWLLILSGQSPLGLSPARYHSSPRLLTKLARWRGGLGAWLPFSFFLFPFPLGSSSLRGY